MRVLNMRLETSDTMILLHILNELGYTGVVTFEVFHNLYTHLNYTLIIDFEYDENEEYLSSILDIIEKYTSAKNENIYGYIKQRYKIHFDFSRDIH